MIALHSTSDSGFHLIASQIVIGLGGALTIALIQSAVQVSVPHAFVAQSIAALNVFPCMGNAIGAAVAGAVWSNLLPGYLLRELASTGHQNDVGSIYAEPLTWIASYPIGTTTRTAVIEAYSIVWRLMMIIATVICATSVLSTMRMKNLKLNDFLSVVEETGKLGNGSVDADKEDKGRLFGDRLFEKVEHALWKTCARCRVKGPEGGKQDKTGGVDSSTLAALEDDAGDEKKTGRSLFSLSKPGEMHDSSSKGKSRAAEEVVSDATLSTMSSLGPAPILVVDRVPDDDDDRHLVPHSAPVGPPSSFFRSPHSVQRSSPLARRVEGDSYL